MSTPRGDSASGAKRSPEVARFLSIEWEDTTLPSRQDGDYEDEASPLASLVSQTPTGRRASKAKTKAPRPALVYLYDGRLAPEVAQDREADMFGDDDVAVASRIIRFIRIDASQIDEADLKQIAPKLPCIYLLDGKGRKVGSFAGFGKSRGVLSALGKLYRKQYAGSLQAMIKKMDRVLKAWEINEDAVYLGNKRLKELKERQEKRDTPNVRKALVKQNKEMEELNKEKEKLTAQRAKLLDPPLSKSFKKLVASAR